MEVAKKFSTKALTIGQVAKLAEVGIDTIRFYEKKGVIQEPKRLASGYRQYDENTPRKIRFIKKAQELGFTLKEVKELLELKINRKAPCQSVRMKAETKMREIESKVNDLSKMKDALLKMVFSCSGKGTTVECSILESFEKEGMSHGK